MTTFKKLTMAAAGFLLCGLAHADLTANVPLDSSRFQLMDAQLLTQYASQGNHHAQFFLAKRLQKGEGLSQDSKTAAYWYGRAAADGIAPAQLNLGIMYLKGEGVSTDRTKARFWLEKAALLGDNRASYALAVLDEKNSRLVDAYKWYELSSREAMLDDNIKNHAKAKIGQLALNLSSTEIETAKRSANAWFQNK